MEEANPLVRPGQEDKDVGGSCQGRQKSWSCFQHNFEHSGYKPEPLHLQEDDGNEGMRDVQEVPQVKHTPNTIRHKRRKSPNESRNQVTTWRGGKPPEGNMGQNTQDRTLERWFKVTVSDGRKYDKTWLMNSIQSRCSVPFTPVDFHYLSSSAHFFVQHASAASALKALTYKICDEENQKIPIFVNTSNAPYSVRNKLKPKEMEQLKLTMNKRYHPFQKALDLQRLRFDPDLVGFHIDILLNRRNCMAATLQIIKENFPELLSLNLCNNKLHQLNGLSDLVLLAPSVKILNLSKNQLASTQELVKMKGLKLQELWLEGNPLCGTFPDQSTYVRLSNVPTGSPLNLQADMGILCPKDGQVLPPPIIVDIDRPYLRKPCKASYRGPEATKTLVMQFLKKYYCIYDSGDRRGLLGAYHDEACFSLTIPFNPKDPYPSSLFEYFKDNRDMKSLKDPYLQVQLLKYTKRDIVCSLCVLPNTQHILPSFMVDMWFQTDRMLFFSVNGVFKEVEGSSQGSVHALSRTFITIPASNSGIFIMNDELFVRDIIPKKTQGTFAIPAHLPIYSSLLNLSQEQRDMVLAFSTQSGMKLLWSQR
ncbi:nuclear RNA export factor 2-like [Hipposideros larvatus]